MEKLAIEGESPVGETIKTLWICFPSTMGHGKSRRNLDRPRPKTKYSNWTDSAQVPWGKVEKNPGEGSEIEPEIIDLQAVEALWSERKLRQWVTACLLDNEPASYFNKRV